MISRYIIHHHRTGKSHYDFRVLAGEEFRSWSLLKEPPGRTGEQRLAIERERMPAESALKPRVEEEMFGEGRSMIWDEGEIEVIESGGRRWLIVLRGARLQGRYEMKQMRWYPGNRWLMKKL
jgi:hypothetical protein